MTEFDPGQTEQKRNNDLVWLLDSLQDRSEAEQFVLQFQNRLCVYSPSVRQVYSNYSMHFPREENRNLVILPSPYAFHDTFHHVNESSVSRTGLHIIPGAALGKNGLYLLTLSRNRPGKFRPVALEKAIAMLEKKYPKTDPFLPVLVKGDLKPFRSKVPCLHLHRIDAKKIEGLSQFEINDIRACLYEKFLSLLDIQ